MTYFDELSHAMAACAADPSAVFVGQGALAGGTAMVETLRDVPKHRRLEFPVAEDLQMGFCTGLALEGKTPICIFPRWNFAICAANQIINHLDRLPLYSAGGYRPRVLIRVGAPANFPLDAGPQHDADFTAAFRAMLRTIEIVDIHDAATVRPAYRHAMQIDHSSILVEHTGLYNAPPLEGNDEHQERHATGLR